MRKRHTCIFETTAKVAHDNDRVHKGSEQEDNGDDCCKWMRDSQSGMEIYTQNTVKERQTNWNSVFRYINTLVSYNAQ